MPITHRVRRPWSGVTPGELIDVNDPVRWPGGFRNLSQLERQNYIEALDEKEIAAIMSEESKQHAHGLEDEPRVPATPPKPQPAPAQTPVVEALPPADQRPAPDGGDTHPATHNPNDAPAPPGPDSHPATHHADDEPARAPQPRKNQNPPRRSIPE